MSIEKFWQWGITIVLGIFLLLCIPPIFKLHYFCQLGDVNSDGSVDPLDSGYILARYGSKDMSADLNKDHKIDQDDSFKINKLIPTCSKLNNNL